MPEPDDYRKRRHLSYQTPPSTRCHLSHANVTDSGSAVNGAGTPDRFLFYRCLCRSDHLGKRQSESTACQRETAKCGGFHQTSTTDFSRHERLCVMDFHHYSLIAFQTKCHVKIYGRSGLYFSISTRLVCCGFPFASGEGRRVVSVFTQPPWSILSPDILASCQAPGP